jgi:hypothetical protein
VGYDHRTRGDADREQAEDKIGTKLLLFPLGDLQPFHFDPGAADLRKILLRLLHKPAFLGATEKPSTASRPFPGKCRACRSPVPKACCG